MCLGVFCQRKSLENIVHQPGYRHCNQRLDPEETYKYLGVNEGDGINHASMKKKIRKEYYQRIRLILKTELNSENRIEAINSLV